MAVEVRSDATIVVTSIGPKHTFDDVDTVVYQHAETLENYASDKPFNMRDDPLRLKICIKWMRYYNYVPKTRESPACNLDLKLELGRLREHLKVPEKWQIHPFLSLKFKSFVKKGLVLFDKRTGHAKYLSTTDCWLSPNWNGIVEAPDSAMDFGYKRRRQERQLRNGVSSQRAGTSSAASEEGFFSGNPVWNSINPRVDDGGRECSLTVQPAAISSSINTYSGDEYEFIEVSHTTSLDIGADSCSRELFLLKDRETEALKAIKEYYTALEEAKNTQNSLRHQVQDLRENLQNFLVLFKKDKCPRDPKVVLDLLGIGQIGAVEKVYSNQSISKRTQLNTQSAQTRTFSHLCNSQDHMEKIKTNKHRTTRNAKQRRV